MAYVYRYIRLDTNQPFYIGIGCDNSFSRAKQLDNRSKYFNNIISKTKYEVEILLYNLTWEDAKEKEKEFIKLYGRKDNGTGILCNMTDGGDGVLGVIATDKQRSISSITGKKNKGRKWTIEQKLNLKLIRASGVSDETKKKLSEAGKGRIPWNKGKDAYNKGIKLSDEQKEKLKKPKKSSINMQKPKNKTTCPHCNLIGSINNLKRYHFDNCKNIKNN
jgi:hypothetical protein